MNNITRIDVNQPKTFIYDLEVYPNFFYGSFYNIDTGEYIGYELGDDLINDIIRNPLITLIGWNSLNYDDMMLKYISSNAVSAPTGFGAAMDNKSITEHDLYELSKEIIEGDPDTRAKWIRALRWEDPIYTPIDLKSLLDPMPSLKKLEIRMRYKSVEDLPLNPHQPVSEENKPILKNYCKNDVAATHYLYEHYALTHIRLREFLAEKFNLDVIAARSMSEPKIAEHILSKLAANDMHTTPWVIKGNLLPTTQVDISTCVPGWIKFSTPYMQDQLQQIQDLTLDLNPNTGYAIAGDLKRIITIGDKDYQMGIGGLHSVDSPGVWSNDMGQELIDADVTSYYPSMVLRDDLHPRGYSKVWVDKYRGIYNERMVAKADPTKGTESYALKIILNATFGKFGSQYSSFYDPQLLLSITVTGQLGLLMLIEACHEHDIKVLSANTDGIVVNPTCEVQADLFQLLCLQWEKATKLNLEYTHYQRYARRDVNAYTAKTLDGKIKNKGAFAPPDIKHDVQAPIIQQMARAYLLDDITPEDYMENYLDDEEHTSTHDFTFSFSATRAFVVSLVEEVHTTELTKSNRWYIATGRTNQLSKFGGVNNSRIKIPNGANIVIANRIDTPEKLPLDLDFDYYITKAHTLIKSCEVS